MKNLNKNVPCYLIIRTNAYTGNFVRELIGYSFGRLIGGNNHGYRKYIAAFWNAECNHEIDSLEMLKKFQEEFSLKIKENSEKKLFETFVNKKSLSEEEAAIRVQKFKEKRDKRDYEESLERLYDSVLLYTTQLVDDWEEDTFYNIISYSGEYNDLYDSIYVQFKSPEIPEKFEKIIVKRIQNFFKLEILKKFWEYEHLCSENFYENDFKELKLLSLELVDNDGNIIKKYEV